MDRIIVVLAFVIACRSSEPPPAARGSATPVPTPAPGSAVAKPATGSGSGSAVADRPPIKLRSRGKGAITLPCDGAVCGDAAFSMEGTTLVIGVEGPPKTTVLFPGTQVRIGDDGKPVDVTFEVADWVARTTPDDDKFGLQWDIVDGTGGSVVIRLKDLVEEMLKIAMSGKPIAFALDKDSKYPRDVIARYAKYETAGSIGYIGTLGAEAAIIGEIDLLTLENYNKDRPGPACHYVDERGNRVDKTRFLTDIDVSVFDRRTGKKVASTRITPPLPPCESTIAANASLGATARDEQVQAYLRGMLRPRPAGEHDVAPPALPLLGDPKLVNAPDPDSGEVPWPPELESKLATRAAKLGIRDASGQNDLDLFDTVSGGLGEDMVDIEEVKLPAKLPADDSIAGSITPKLAVVVATHTHSGKTPPKATALLAAVLAATGDGSSQPDLAKVDAAINAHLKADSFGSKPSYSIGGLAPYVTMSKFFDAGAAEVILVWLGAPPDKTYKRACKSTPARAVCVSRMDEPAEKLLGRAW